MLICIVIWGEMPSDLPCKCRSAVLVPGTHVRAAAISPAAQCYF